MATVAETIAQRIAADVVTSVRENTFVSSVRASTGATLERELLRQAFPPLEIVASPAQLQLREAMSHTFPTLNMGIGEAKPPDFSNWLRQSIHPLFDWIGTNTYGELVDFQSVRKITQEATDYLNSRDFKALRQTRPIGAIYPYAVAQIQGWSESKRQHMIESSSIYDEHDRAIPPKGSLRL
jgi:hypothetical protein